jgi:hypothetical protein
MTCGKLTVNITAGTVELTGGVPVFDQPTHLKGYYKYAPKGGDSCVIGIGLTKTTGAIKDNIGFGSFSTKDTITDWTPFSAWIDYISANSPDTMNIIAMSTAQELMTPGTVLFVDDLYLDYTVGYNDNDPAAGIRVYNDRETSRLMIFFDFPSTETTTINFFNMRGQCVSAMAPCSIGNDRRIIHYGAMNKGVYVLEILHNNKKFTKKFFLDL